jgi:molecular chaperone DnaJ
VAIHVEPHPVFRRDGLDLRCEAVISFGRAALGGKITVPTLDGEEPLEIPAGTQTGSELRLSGRGVPAVNGRGKGDQVVRVVVRTPTRMSDEARELFERLAALEEKEGTTKGIFERVKDIFS